MTVNLILVRMGAPAVIVLHRLGVIVLMDLMDRIVK